MVYRTISIGLYPLAILIGIMAQEPQSATVWLVIADPFKHPPTDKFCPITRWGAYYSFGSFVFDFCGCGYGWAVTIKSDKKSLPLNLFRLNLRFISSLTFVFPICATQPVFRRLCSSTHPLSSCHRVYKASYLPNEIIKKFNMNCSTKRSVESCLKQMKK